jgi:hypothetical protein
MVTPIEGALLPRPNSLRYARNVQSSRREDDHAATAPITPPYIQRFLPQLRQDFRVWHTFPFWAADESGSYRGYDCRALIVARPVKFEPRRKFQWALGSIIKEPSLGSASYG